MRGLKHHIALFLAHLKMMGVYVDKDILRCRRALDEGTEVEEDSLRDK